MKTDRISLSFGSAGGKNLLSFNKEVYEGLYDTELKLRMDGLVIPEASLR